MSGVLVILVLLHLGMIVVPLDKALPENEIESSIIRSEATCVIFDKKYLDIFNKLKNQNKSKLKHFICMDFENDVDNVLSYNKLLENGKTQVANGNILYDNVVIDNNSMTIMLFTSRYYCYFKNCNAFTSQRLC